jgi:hypothetical protein
LPQGWQLPGRGHVLEAVPLGVRRVGRVDRPQAVGREALVDLGEVLDDQLLLGVGDPALMRLARVLRRAVVESFRAGRGGGPRLRRPLGGLLASLSKVAASRIVRRGSLSPGR